ncbi:unnamed protein product [Malus baccata var. baccata]
MVILLETKNKSSRYEYLTKKLKMEFLHAVEPKGIGGGLCLFWKDASQILLVQHSEFMIEAKVWDEEKMCPWRLFGIYASTDEKKRREQWRNLGNRITKGSDPCLLIGDFNDILCNGEKEGGKQRSMSSMRDFREFVASNELADLGYEGYPFTWRNKRDSLPIQQRLDRGLASSGWLNFYPDTKIIHVALEGSDHSLLLLTTKKSEEWRGNRFMYDARWSKQEECRNIITKDWGWEGQGSHAFRFCEKLKLVSMSLKGWYREKGRNSKKTIDKLKGELRKAYQSVNFASAEVHQMEEELQEANRKEEEYWRVKSRVQWLNYGDKNTKFFHAQTMKRRSSNKIKGLEDAHGVWHSDPDGISKLAVDYFADIFKSSNPIQLEEITGCVQARISQEDNLMLTAPVSNIEIQVAAFQIPPTRAPGPDGFSGSFYQDHWEVVGNDVTKIIRAFWYSGKLLKKLNHTNLVLIPKVSCPKTLGQYRPIALCNVGYKILAKVITNRLKKVIPKVISENQSAFVAGKNIQDNILVVHEILHSLTYQTGEDRSGMALKLDMAKAYDRVEWGFLLVMMAKLGFDPMFCKRIKECVSTPSYSILVNGTPTGHILPQRGLRQGDPLSPFLFLLCTEGFSALIRNRMEYGNIHGVRVNPNGTPISHLFFADDSVLFCEATVEDAKGVRDILNSYAAGLGQMINMNKSSIFYGAKVKKREKKLIEATLNIQSRMGFGKYLGLQADFGISKKAVFEDVRERLEVRMVGWAEQFLSQAGKEVLIKSVAMDMPNHAMSCFKLPIGVCKDIEKAIRSYWWRGSINRKGVHWVSWERLQKEKGRGGLGFKDIQCFNLAFLAKIGWRLILNPDSLLAKVMKEKYYPGKTFREASGGKRSSWGWKSVLECRKVLEKGMLWRVGDGASISIRKDPWFPMPSTFQVRPKENTNATLVSDLIDPNTRTWNVETIEDCFSQEESKVILSIPISRTGSTDRLRWFHTADGNYSVKSGYRIAMELMENGELGKKGRGSNSEKTKHNTPWKSIWRLDVPSKLRFFIWKCCNHALAVRRNLKRRQMRVDNVCGVCGQFDETENHLFFRCETSHRFWFCSPLQLNSIDLEGADFLQSWVKFCNRVEKLDNRIELLQEFVFGLWRLWKNRNDIIFSRKYHEPAEILLAWRKSLVEYRSAVEKRVQCMEPTRIKLANDDAEQKIWLKPAFGTIKINTDAAWSKTTYRAGLGWVARDFAVIESDAKTIVQMIRKELTQDFRLECILDDIEVLARRLQAVAFVFVPRECNKAAHLVAKFGPKIHLIPHLASESPPTVRPQFMPINPIMWAFSLVFKVRVAFNGGKVGTRDWIAEPGKLTAGVEVYDDLLRRRADIKGDSRGSGEGDVDEVLMVGLIVVGLEWMEWKRWMGKMVCTKKGER